jgi:hypothetical protein
MSTAELDALLAGAAPRNDEERRLAATIDAVREAPPRAPERLRERVGTLPRQEQRTLALPRPRRALLAVTAGAAALAVGLAALHGLRTPSGSPVAESTVSGGTVTRQAKAPSTFDQAVPAPATGGGALGQPLQTQAAPAPSGKRLQRYQASITVRVESDKLGRATNRATQIARSLGGYAASVQYRTPQGQPGESFLELRIPTQNVQEALARLTSLGTLASQQVFVKDLQQIFERQTAQIAELRQRVRLLTDTLKSQSLTPVQRIQLQLELADAKRALAQRTHARKGTIAAGTLARVSLVLTEAQHAAVPPVHHGRLHRILTSAVSFLALEATILLYGLIVVGPLLALAAAAWWGLGIRRRRDEARLLSAAS